MQKIPLEHLKLSYYFSLLLSFSSLANSQLWRYRPCSPVALAISWAESLVLPLLSSLFGILLPALVLLAAWFYGGTFTVNPGKESFSIVTNQIFVIALTGAVVEEIVFRGIMYELCVKRWGQNLAIITTSIIFAAGHLSSLNNASDFIFCIEASIFALTSYIVIIVITLLYMGKKRNSSHVNELKTKNSKYQS